VFRSGASAGIGAGDSIRAPGDAAVTAADEAFSPPPRNNIAVHFIGFRRRFA